MAIVGTLPSTIHNGDVEDATVVMSLFAFIQSQVNGNACPATTGSIVLKGDGVGGTTSASPGVDYLAGNQPIALPASARTVPVSVGFSATPSFDASQSNVFYLGAMSANVTSFSITNGADGQTLSIRFVQDATGGRTVALGASVHASGGPQSAANSVSWLVLTLVVSAARWEGTWASIP